MKNIIFTSRGSEGLEIERIDGDSLEWSICESGMFFLDGNSVAPANWCYNPDDGKVYGYLNLAGVSETTRGIYEGIISDDRLNLTWNETALFENISVDNGPTEDFFNGDPDEGKGIQISCNGPNIYILYSTVEGIFGTEYFLYKYVIATNTFSYIEIPFNADFSVEYSGDPNFQCKWVAMEWDGDNRLYIVMSAASMEENVLYRFDIDTETFTRLADVPMDYVSASWENKGVNGLCYFPNLLVLSTVAGYIWDYVIDTDTWTRRTPLESIGHAELFPEGGIYKLDDTKALVLRRYASAGLSSGDYIYNINDYGEILIDNTPPNPPYGGWPGGVSVPFVEGNSLTFCEVQFPTGISRGATGGPVFSTVVITAASGHEQRNAQWSNSRRKWNVAHGLRSNAQRDELIKFFLARRGMFQGFRFKDWSDFKVLSSTPEDMELITSNDFQLVKRYTSGGVTITRNIVKPVAESVRIWDGTDEVLTGWSVNLSTGVVTFEINPLYLPAASFEFDVPARFDTDEMNWSQEESTFGNWNGIPVVELLSE